MAKLYTPRATETAPGDGINLAIIRWADQGLTGVGRSTTVGICRDGSSATYSLPASGSCGCHPR